MSDRYKSVVCADLLLKKKVNDEEYLLLMRRQNTGSNDGEYELPGGHLEANEDLFDAMIREAKEELLIDLKREDLSIVHILHHYNGERINFIFESNKEVTPLIGEKEKCSKIVWAKANELPKETTEKVKIIIDNIINNRLYDKL